GDADWSRLLLRERTVGMAVELPEFPASGYVPQANRSLVASRSEDLAVGRPSQGPEFFVVAVPDCLPPLRLFAARQIPHANGAVPTAAGSECLPVRGKGDRGDPLPVALELAEQPPTGDVPKVDGCLGGAERQQPAIRGEGHPLVLRPPVGADREAALLPRLQVPKPECPVLAPGEQGLVVGGEVDLRDVALVSRDAAAVLAGRHVPQA